MISKKYLFVCGCPRSGTTALAKMLTASDDIVLGLERYGHRSHPDRFTLTPDLFEKERFLDVQPGDTFYDSLDFFARFYANVEQKLDTCHYIGEKRPDLYLSYSRLFQQFPGAMVFFIFRDVFEVASSYNVRAREGSWPKKKNYRAAVQEWNQALKLTLEAVQQGYPIHCVEYKEVLAVASHQQWLFEMLDVPYTETTASGVQRILDEAKKVAENRRLELTDQEIQFIEATASFEDYEKIQALKMRFTDIEEANTASHLHR